MEKIKKLKQLIIKEQLDGYIIPKNNDESNKIMNLLQSSEVIEYLKLCLKSLKHIGKGLDLRS